MGVASFKGEGVASLGGGVTSSKGEVTSEWGVTSFKGEGVASFRGGVTSFRGGGVASASSTTPSISLRLLEVVASSEEGEEG